MSWQAFDNVGGMGVRSVSLHVGPVGGELALLVNGTTASRALLQSLGTSVSDTQLTVRATAVDGAAWSTSLEMTCLVALPSSISIGTAWLTNESGAVELAPGVFAIDAQATSRQICLSDWAANAGLGQFHYWWRGFESSTDLSIVAAGTTETTLAPLELPIESPACFNDTVALDADEVQLLRVSAVSLGGVQSAVAELVLVQDSTPPTPAGEPLVYNAGPSGKHQASACCLMLAWDSWWEPESRVAGYSLCMLTSENDTQGVCFSVGDATRVALVSSSCEDACTTPQSTESDVGHGEWLSATHDLIVINDTTTGQAQLRFMLSATNVLGQEAAIGPYAVTIVEAPVEPNITVHSPAVRADSVCAAAAGADVFVASGRTFNMSWTRDEDSFDYRVCKNYASAPADCAMVAEDNGTRAHAIRFALPARASDVEYNAIVERRYATPHEYPFHDLPRPPMTVRKCSRLAGLLLACPWPPQ